MLCCVSFESVCNRPFSACLMPAVTCSLALPNLMRDLVRYAACDSITAHYTAYVCTDCLVLGHAVQLQVIDDQRRAQAAAVISCRETDMHMLLLIMLMPMRMLMRELVLATLVLLMLVLMLLLPLHCLILHRDIPISHSISNYIISSLSSNQQHQPWIFQSLLQLLFFLGFHQGC